MRIVNVRGMRPNDPSVVYCGRAFAGWKGSPLGNPFSHHRGDGTREECIEKYRRWLWGQLRNQVDEVWETLDALTPDNVLGCWCAPLPCHCEVIREAWKILPILRKKCGRQV